MVSFQELLTKFSVYVSLVLFWTLEYSDAVCNPECVRGICLTVTDGFRNKDVCECGLFYEGAQCESINLNRPNKEIGSTYISFSWNQRLYFENIPEFEDFVFLVYLRGSENIRSDCVVKKPTVDETKSAQVTLSGLISGGTPYVVCFIHNITNFDNLTENEMIYLTHEDRDGCLSFRTGYDENDPFTKAAISVAVALSVALGIIFFIGVVCECRKNSVGKKIRRSLRLSWKQIMLDNYAESKDRVKKRQLDFTGGKTEIPHSDLAFSIADDSHPKTPAADLQRY